MTLLHQQETLLHFLLAAKQHTYAAQGGRAIARPLLPHSRQLEWQDGAWLYRDIYFGVAYFVGQETVTFRQQPYWSMSYAGGTAHTIQAEAEVSEIYHFLQNAMQQIDLKHPFRGPEQWQEGEYCYTNQQNGDLNAFWGHEIITKKGKSVYELRYSGGILR